MKKTWFSVALLSLALAFAGCQTSPIVPEASADVLGTMALDGTMRDLDGNTVPLQAAAANTRSEFSIRLEPRQTAAPAIRVVHGSPDTPAVDILVNDTVAIKALTYQNQAGPASLPVGTYNVKVNLANTATTAINADLTLEPGAYYAAYALGFTKDISAKVLRELPFKLTGIGLVRLLHGAPSAPKVDIYLSRPGRDINRLRPLLRNVSFKDASPYFAVRPGELQVRIAPAGTKTVAIDVTLNVAGGSLQTAVAADAVGGGAPLSAYVVDELAGEPTPQSILEIAGGNPQLSTLVGAVQSAGLVEALSGKGPFTVFAPTNDAFAKLSAVPGGEALKKVLLYHVAAGKFSARDLLEKRSLETLQGENIKIRFKDGMIVLNDNVGIVAKDIVASNGIVHVIDTVLIPPSFGLKSILEIATATPALSTLVGAVQSAGLVEALSGAGPFTVFAPTNDAFAKLASVPGGETLKTVLLYHVASGKFTAKDLLFKHTLETLQGEQIKLRFEDGMLILNDAVKIVAKDVMASNGIVHVIDTVLIPPSLAPKSILEIASADPRFSTLVSAVKATGLDHVLATKGPFTVFAPTNDAFEALKQKLGGALPTGDALKKVLLYHVVASRVSAAQLLEAGMVKTVLGQDVTAKTIGADVILNDGVKVLIPDINASNGVIHAIDSVLIPADTH
jgi:uncharacterized surface protein with fasciclin (FAS1) repeats